MKKIITILLASAMLFACGCSPKNIGVGAEQETLLDYLVNDNASKYSIVYSDTCTKSEYFAVTELKDFIYQSTGIELPLLTDNDVAYSDGLYAISVGGTKLIGQAGLEFNFTKVKDGSFYIQTSGKTIFIQGMNDRGTIFGVYEFLERNLGIRFLSDDFNYVPKLGVVKLYESEIFETPDFEMRNVLTGKNWGTNPLFNLRMRMVHDYITMPENYGGSSGWYTDIPTSHSSLYYVPTADYLKSNPEMYAIKDGAVKDICFTNGVTDEGEIDTSMDVSAIKVAIETLKKFVLSTQEDIKYFMFGQMDFVSASCTCSRCVAASEKYKRSGVLVRFANLLAREIQKWADDTQGGREIRVVTFAYWYSDVAPVKEDGQGGYAPIDNTVIAQPNLYIRLAPIEQNNYYSFSDKEHQTVKYYEMMRQWPVVSKHFMMWTYHTEFFEGYFLYFPNMQTWAENFKQFKDMGVTYFMMQNSYTEKNNWQAIMQTYVASKLMWDSSLSVSQLIDEFITLYYGDVGGKYVKNFMARIEDHFMTLFQNNKFQYSCYEKVLYEPGNQPLAYLENSLAILDSGIAAVQNSTSDNKAEYLNHIKQVALTPLFSMLYNANYYFGASPTKFATISDRFFTLCNEFDVKYYKEGDSNTIANFKESLGL